MLATLVSALFLGLVALSAYLYWVQDRLIYFPSSQLVADPSAIGLKYEEIELRTSDDVVLHGWYVPSRNAVLTLLFMHGNAGNISHRLESLALFNRLGLSSFIFDYRGYGRSEGSPSELGTYRDAEAAWRYLTEERAIPADRIIVFGRSLGAAIAAWLSERHRPAGTILESPFSSVADLAREIYPFLPVRWLVRHHYDTRARAAGLRSPLLVIHSAEDEIIPVEHGRRVYESSAEPKELLLIQGGHNDGFLRSLEAYEAGIRGFLRGLSRDGPQPGFKD